MSTNCALCGYRDNEVKSGSAISEKGKRITLKVEDTDDLSRDILKVSSVTAGLEALLIPIVFAERNLRSRDTRNRSRFARWNSWRKIHDCGRHPQPST
jgi:zinc finger protein